MALLIVAGVFVHQACQHRVAQEIADEVVAILAAETLGIALHALTVLWQAVFCLAYTRQDTGEQKRPGVTRALEEELVFLAGTQWHRLLVGGGVEGRDDRPHPLVILLIKLLLCFFLLFFRGHRWRGVCGRCSLGVRLAGCRRRGTLGVVWPTAAVGASGKCSALSA